VESAIVPDGDVCAHTSNGIPSPQLLIEDRQVDIEDEDGKFDWAEMDEDVHTSINAEPGVTCLGVGSSSRTPMGEARRAIWTRVPGWAKPPRGFCSVRARE
jgi:putative SOS response-associated peptidase YedK